MCPPEFWKSFWRSKRNQWPPEEPAAAAALLINLPSRSYSILNNNLPSYLATTMDEQLIDEVALHAVIYNRQKYYLNGTANGQNQANKYETKDEAWQAIAMKLRSDGK